VSRQAFASTLALLVASGTAPSKAELGRITGLSRTTIDAGIETLLELGALRVAGLESVHGRGRPAEILELDPSFGVVLVADCGATHASLAVFDLGQRLLGHQTIRQQIGAGPEAVLGGLVPLFEQMLKHLELDEVPRTLVMGVPGPVDHWGGTVVRPPIMPGWDGFPVVEVAGNLIGGRVLLENEVNLRALGEARAYPPARGPVVYLKVGTGIGLGIVSIDGTLLRGADGAAGDIGHVRSNLGTERCACGNVGCLEAFASVPAIARKLGVLDDGGDAIDTLTELIRQQDDLALTAVKDAAEHLGDVVAGLIHVLNPERVLLGGNLALASDHLLAVVRSIVYRRALPLATRNLTIARPALGQRSGLAGALAIGIEAEFDPEALAERLQRPR
jgi:predicted NBD/HSP70 family sugar kinase/biotin operon repressor